MLTGVPVRTRTFCACLECRKRKQKCDGEDPCARCSRLGLRCEYEPIKEEEARMQKFKRKGKLRQMNDSGMTIRDGNWTSPESAPAHGDMDSSSHSPALSLTKTLSDRSSASSRVLQPPRPLDMQMVDQRHPSSYGPSMPVRVDGPSRPNVINKHTTSMSWDGPLRQDGSTSTLPIASPVAQQSRLFASGASPQRASHLHTVSLDSYRPHHRYRLPTVSQQLAQAQGAEQSPITPSSSSSWRSHPFDPVGGQSSKSWVEEQQQGRRMDVESPEDAWRDQQERDGHHHSHQPPPRRLRAETLGHSWGAPEQHEPTYLSSGTPMMTDFSTNEAATSTSDREHPSAAVGGTGEAQAQALVTCICTPWLECMRVSEESFGVLNLIPSEIKGHNLIEMVHAADVDRVHALVERLHLKMASSASVPHPLTIDHLSPALLVRPSLSSPFVQDTIRLRRKHDQDFDFFSVRLHVGGAFAGYAGYYVVASIHAVGRGASHPLPRQLSSTLIDLSDDPRYFSSQHILRSAS